jgi:hypothetical protein
MAIPSRACTAPARRVVVMDRVVARRGILVALAVWLQVVCGARYQGLAELLRQRPARRRPVPGAPRGRHIPGPSPGARTAPTRGPRCENQPEPRRRLGYGPASAADRARFAPASRCREGSSSSSSVHTVAVGGLGRRRRPPSTRRRAARQRARPSRTSTSCSSSTLVAGPKASHASSAAGSQVIALSMHGVPVAGWFQGDRLTLSTGPGPRRTSPSSLSASVPRHPPS